MYFLQKHQSGSLHYGIWSARGSPDDFRKEEEFGSVLFPLVNANWILRNAVKDETPCITALHNHENSIHIFGCYEAIRKDNDLRNTHCHSWYSSVGYVEGCAASSVAGA